MNEDDRVGERLVPQLVMAAFHTDHDPAHQAPWCVLSYARLGGFSRRNLPAAMMEIEWSAQRALTCMTAGLVATAVNQLALANRHSRCLCWASPAALRAGIPLIQLRKLRSNGSASFRTGPVSYTHL